MHTLADVALGQPSFSPIADDGQALYVSGLLALRDGDSQEAVTLLTRRCACDRRIPACGATSCGRCW